MSKQHTIEIPEMAARALKMMFDKLDEAQFQELLSAVFHQGLHLMFADMSDFSSDELCANILIHFSELNARGHITTSQPTEQGLTFDRNDIEQLIIPARMVNGKFVNSTKEDIPQNVLQEMEALIELALGYGCQGFDLQDSMGRAMIELNSDTFKMADSRTANRLRDLQKTTKVNPEVFEPITKFRN